MCLSERDSEKERERLKVRRGERLVVSYFDLELRQMLYFRVRNITFLDQKIYKAI